MRVATIFVPVEGSLADNTIAPGSAIVAVLRNDSDVNVVYIEGNLYGASNLIDLQDRIKCAAGRLFTRYPTVAIRGFHTSEFEQNFIAVGTIDENYKIVLSEPEKAAEYASGDRTKIRRAADDLPALR